MGGVPCLGIIEGGQLAYASVEHLNERINNIDTINLEAAIRASCEGISFTALYLHIDDKYIGENYTQPIIDLHQRIINELPAVSKQEAQNLVNELFVQLMEASRKLEELFE